MSVVADVGLISGKTPVEAGLDESVVTLKRRAQTALAVGRGRLVESAGGLLDDEQTVKKANVETGNFLSLQVRRVQVLGAGSLISGSFAAILGDGTVAFLGTKGCGGDHRAVQEQLTGVQQIQASQQAFAAILTDGLVGTEIVL